MRASFPLLLASVSLLASHCKNTVPAPEQGAPSASAARASPPVDRLGPGELSPGEGDVFGLPVPRGMTIQGKFRDSAILVGRVRAEAVANYVRDHVDATRAEIGAARTVFPSVRIKNGPPDRYFRIEILRDGSASRILVHDVTPAAPTPPLQGVSNDELWRRAGFNRDGTPTDGKAFE